jgi:capsular polysaccharide export protein
MPPDPVLYDAFCRVLHRHCLVRGGLASESATQILVANAADRLLAD